jgi:hypothetical protein
MGNLTVHMGDTHCCFGLVQQLGRLGSGWQPSSKAGRQGNQGALRRRPNLVACRWPGGLRWGTRARGSGGGLIRGRNRTDKSSSGIVHGGEVERWGVSINNPEGRVRCSPT